MVTGYTAETRKLVDLLKRTDIYLAPFLWVRNQGVTQLAGSVSGSLRRPQSRSELGLGGPALGAHSQGWRQAASAPHCRGLAVGLVECPHNMAAGLPSSKRAKRG